MEKVTGWIDLVDVLAGVARRYPQTSYAGLKISLQQEWAFFQRINLHIREVFRPVEEALENPSSRNFSREPLPKSLCEVSPAFQSSRQGWKFLTRIYLPGRTGRPCV